MSFIRKLSTYNKERHCGCFWGHKDEKDTFAAIKEFRVYWGVEEIKTNRVGGMGTEVCTGYLAGGLLSLSGNLSR